MENKLLIVDLYTRFYQAAQNSIPICRSTKYIPKPWWTDSLKISKAQRERLFQVYRRNKTILNLVKWKQARAQYKHNVKESKKDCWRKFVAEQNKRTPMAKVYEIMRKIKGRAQWKINILCEDGQYYSSIPDIVNRIVNTFSQISSNEHYPLVFQQLKNNCEQIALNFYSDNTEIYN